MADADVISDSRLYEDDFYSWTQRQADLIRAGRLDEADLHNIIEELETLGRAERNALRSSYRLAAMHLLKIKYQPSRETDSWRGTISRERNRIEDSLQDNPGLRPKRAEIFAEAYPGARREAASETKLPLKTFPVACPFTLAQIEDHAFWPAPHDN